jgi:hypothetical protein
MENEYIEKMFATNLISINDELQYVTLKPLFIEIQQAYRDLSKITIKKLNVKKPIQLVMKDIRTHSGNYLPLPVLDSIKSNYLGNTYVVDVDISQLLNGRKCKIKITFYKMKDNPVTFNTLDIYCNAIITWLIVAKKYETDKCLESLKIEIYLTKEQKLLNAKIGELNDATGGGEGETLRKLQHKPDYSGTLGSNNVNTALTYRCRGGSSIILLYRSEDLIKTFFHETFHTLNFDFSNPAKNDVRHLFNVNSPLRLFY